MQLNQAPGAPAADDLVADTTTQAFMKDVIEESKKRPVLVDFWAPWCGPCKTLTPILEKAVRAAKGKVKLVKMNIDEHPQIPGQLGIQSIPAVFAFANGQPVDGFIGALPEGQVTAFIERVAGKPAVQPMPGPTSRRYSRRPMALLAEGDAAGAADHFAAGAGRGSRQRPGARRPRARPCRRRQSGARAPDARRSFPKARKTIRPSLPCVPRSSSPTRRRKSATSSELEAKVAANAADHQARFDLAVALNARGERAKALDHLLEIVRRDRKWNDDGARKQLVQFFEAWGPTDADDARRTTPSFLDSVRVKLPSRNGRRQCR